MFGRKKNKLTAAATPISLDRFEEIAQELDGIKDPAEKVLKIEELRASISVALDDKHTAIAKRARKREILAVVGGHIGQTVAFFTLAALTGLAPLMILAAPGFLGAVKLGEVASDKMTKKLEDQNVDFLDGLAALDKRLAQMTKKTIDNNLEAIASSSRRDAIFEKFPYLKGQFGISAARKMSRKGKPSKGNDPKI